MAKFAPYVCVGIILVLLMSEKILLQRFFNRSLRMKSIDPNDERKVQWQIVLLSGICGFMVSLGVSFEISPNVVQALFTTSLATIMISTLAWIIFWMIDSLLRARIKVELQKEAEKSNLNEE